MGAPPTNALDTAPLSIGADVYTQHFMGDLESLLTQTSF